MERDEVFAQFLLDSGLLSRAQLQLARSSEHSLAQALVLAGYLSEEEVARAQSRSLGIPFVALSLSELQPEALRAIPEAFSRAHNLVAFSKKNDTLNIALVDLASLDVLEGLHISDAIRIHLTDRQSIKKALLRYQQLLKDEYALHIASHTTPEQLVDSLLLHALNQQASVVHLNPSERGTSVRYRIAGALHDAMVLPPAAALGAIARLKSLAKLQSSGDGRFTIAQKGYSETNSQHISVGVSILPTHTGESVVLRLVREGEAQTFTPQLLGLHGEGLERLYAALENRSGLVLVCGEEDSGVTNVLYTLVGMALRPQRNVVTVEERVESRLPGVMQTQSDEERRVFLSTRLRAALRQDPDVIMISSLRDREVAELAVHAANRGMLVIAGIDAQSAAQGIEKLSSSAPPRVLASVLHVAVGARLVRKLCPHSERARLTREEIGELESRGANLKTILEALKLEEKISPDTQWKDVPFYRATQCRECQSGYLGRIGLQEIVPMSMTLCDMIMKESAAEELEAQARSESMLSLVEDGVFKSACGQTTVEEVLAADL